VKKKSMASRSWSRFRVTYTIRGEEAEQEVEGPFKGYPSSWADMSTADKSGWWRVQAVFAGMPDHGQVVDSALVG